MNPPGRNFYIIACACIVAVIFGGLMGEGEYIVPLTVVFVGLCAALYRVFFKGKLMEAAVLACLIFGYIVGQWGFAHIRLGGGNSIFFGEVGLMTCFLVFGIRMAFTKERFVPRIPISLAICAFMGIGLMRFAVDIQSAWGNSAQMLATVRDFATVYYITFFFITYNVLNHQPSRRLIEGVFPVSVVFLVPVYALYAVFPGFFEWLSLAGFPAILPRSDLTGSFLGFGCMYFLLSREEKGGRIWRILVSALCFALMLKGLSRATFVGFGMCVVLLFIAGKLKMIRDLAIVGTIGLVALLVVEGIIGAGASGTGADDSFTHTLVDKISSIVDIGSEYNRNYDTDAGTSSAGNNHFRTEWWKAVYDETTEHAPMTGLGFGYDLAARFLRTYDAPLDPDEFSARSPHSIIMTIFGRMGWIGELAFLFLVFRIFSSALRCAWAVRRKRLPALYLAPWCGITTIFVASCFGVMLEGPMAAVVFWSLLGLAAYREEAMRNAAVPPTKESKPVGKNLAPSQPPLVTAGYY